MPIAQLSPGVIINEVDLTTVVPQVASTQGAIAGVFRWGPVFERVLIDSEDVLVSTFGTPTSFNFETWFTASSFLAYAQMLYVGRVANTSAPTPAGTFTISGTSNTILALTGANSTYNVISLGINSSMTAWQSNNSSVTIGDSISSSNGTHVILHSAMTFTGSAEIQFITQASAYNAFAPAEGGGFVQNLASNSVRNRDEFLAKKGTFDLDSPYLAKWPGSMGNSLRVSQCDTANAFYTVLPLGNGVITATATANVGANTINFVFTPGVSSNVVAANTLASSILASVAINDYVAAGNGDIGMQYLKIETIPTIPTVNATVASFSLGFEDSFRLSTDWQTDTIERFWEFYHLTNIAPGQSDYVRSFGNTAANDELHVVVIDNDGLFSGTPGTVLEVFEGLSRATDSKTNEGAGNYYQDVINHSSKYIWATSDRSNAPSTNALMVASSLNHAAFDANFICGTDGPNESNVTLGMLAKGYDLFSSAEDVDISLVMQGKPRGGVDPGTGQTGFQLANYIIDNIVEKRKDCVAFISPESSNVINNAGNEALDLADWRNATRSTSYAVMDSGYKEMYDRYNDLYRWIPLNGDLAGLCVRTDTTNDPWWSPAGYNRGQIKNLTRLAWNPKFAAREILYKNSINPVMRPINEGTILFGDKTLLNKPSAFDRINVRRLFIVLEKAIGLASKYTLFEFNDAFTRAQFKNLVNPYLRDVKGRRGLTDFLVVCDETNNTGEVIDRNEFVCDIYLKPARSINWVRLNFIAVRTGIAFTEVVGKWGA